MVDVVRTVKDVTYPTMRRELMRALAALGDLEYQERVWVRQEFPMTPYYDDLTQKVHTLYDDGEVLPDVEKSIGSVLIAGDEVDRLRALDVVFRPVLDELGNAPDSAYLAHERWPDVIRAAADALCAMVLAGGWADGW